MGLGLEKKQVPADNLELLETVVPEAETLRFPFKEAVHLQIAFIF